MKANEPPRRKRRRWTGMMFLAALAAALGWYLRDCTGLGLGPGFGLGPGTDDTPAVQARDAAAHQDATAAPRAACELYLSSEGLEVDGKPASLEEAVQACRAAGKAKLRVTGGARAGTYDELLQMLDRERIPVEPN